MKGYKGGRRSLAVGVGKILSRRGSVVLVCKAFGRPARSKLGLCRLEGADIRLGR